MIEVEVKPIVEDDIIYMSENLREEDQQEVEATTDMDFYSAIKHCVDSSPYVAMSGFADGNLVCVFGVSSYEILTDTGYPWCLFTPYLEQYKRVFLRNSKPYVALMQTNYRRLENYVDCRNDMAIRWLKWLGFEFGEPETYGVKGLPFYPFVLEK